MFTFLRNKSLLSDLGKTIQGVQMWLCMRFSLNDEGVHMLIRSRKTIQGVHMCIFMRFSLNVEGVRMLIPFEKKNLII